ncbi:exodeoxyribonuclease III [Trueperella sp. LYQ143]|uniref:exodeoxyribonuclease III n=1 Tax=unclassified Trueperella TaxID=2630174 RepID=UPI0039830781
MRVATVNVNGIRAAVRKGMHEWVAQATPDILLLQEVRAPEDILAELTAPGYTMYAHPSQLKGRAGVAIAVAHGIEVGEIRYGLPTGLAVADAEPPVDTGRWIEADIPQFDTTFVSAYLHSGIADQEEKMAAKYAHLDRVTQRLQELRESATGMSHVLVGGDFNIVHTERDIKNWKSNHNKTAGVLDAEIAYLTKWFEELGYVDAHRRLVGDAQGPYTWWSQRGQAFDNDAGWRIDYQMVCPQLAAAAQTARVDRAPDYASRWSDHAPLVMSYTL